MASLMLAQELSRLTQDVGEEGAAAGQQRGGGAGCLVLPAGMTCSFAARAGAPWGRLPGGVPCRLGSLPSRPEAPGL